MYIKHESSTGPISGKTTKSSSSRFPRFHQWEAVTELAAAATAASATTGNDVTIDTAGRKQPMRTGQRPFQTPPHPPKRTRANPPGPQPDTRKCVRPLALAGGWPMRCQAAPIATMMRLWMLANCAAVIRESVGLTRRSDTLVM
ncbi:hypothetical protein MSHI_25230 [Mycobacterium shinjukuense]|uniref:Uncharacterized protein n=1 Tax=Mycobacterium shinjukuense TaxID=398694 RepID=A0A7I7MS25_9MYCO|nr:hypothetical protein MSHI_25230 [Mycobacterium shinjukuense]